MLHSCPVILESSKARFIIEINALQSHLLPRNFATLFFNVVGPWIWLEMPRNFESLLEMLWMDDEILTIDLNLICASNLSTKPKKDRYLGLL
jgi:hypothetical protein